MRTGVAHGKGLALPVASDYQRLLKQRRFRQLSAVELTSRKRAIPEPEEHERIGRLGLKWGVVGHRNR
jgi:5-formyltetrahydrofolate cyclo-ligase